MGTIKTLNQKHSQMNKINFAGACLLAFGGFLEANALKVQSKLAQA